MIFHLSLNVDATPAESVPRASSGYLPKPMGLGEMPTIVAILRTPQRPLPK